MTIHADDVPDLGDLAYVNLDPRVGREQSGHRPCVIVSPAGYHLKSPYTFICPITSNLGPYAFKVFLPEGLPVRGAVLVDQLKSVDRHARGCRIVGKVSEETMADIRGMISALLISAQT